jgi:hypothetical protein
MDILYIFIYTGFLLQKYQDEFSRNKLHSLDFRYFPYVCK